MKDRIQDFIDRASCREALRLWARVQAEQKLIARRAEREERGTSGLSPAIREQMRRQEERIEGKPVPKRSLSPNRYGGRAKIDMTQEEVTAYLRRIWKESGLTQLKLCEEIGIPNSTFSSYVLGRCFPKQGIWNKIQEYQQRKEGGMAA